MVAKKRKKPGTHPRATAPISPSSTPASPASTPKAAQAPEAATPGAETSVLPPAPPSYPVELETIWDDAVADAYAGLRPQQQSFLLEYLRSGNAAEAYRKAYQPDATPHMASVGGSRTVATKGISDILAKFRDRKTEALFTVAKVFFDMAEAKGRYGPNWKARKDGADGLARIYGLYAPEKREQTGADGGPIQHEVTTYKLPELDT